MCQYLRCVLFLILMKSSLVSTCVFLVFNSCKYKTEFIVVALRTWNFHKKRYFELLLYFALSSFKLAFYVIVVIIFFCKKFLVVSLIFISKISNKYLIIFIWCLFFLKNQRETLLTRKITFIDFSRSDWNCFFDNVFVTMYYLWCVWT